MDLVLCEEGRHVLDIGQLPALDQANYKIVALCPAAAAVCQSNHLAYLKMSDCFDVHEIYSRRHEAFENENRWIEWMDRYIRRMIPDFDKTEFKPSQAYQFVFHILFEAIFIQTTLLKELFHKTKPERVFYWPQSVSTIPYYLIPSATFTSVFVKTLCDSLGIQSIPQSPGNNLATPTLKQTHRPANGLRKMASRLLKKLGIMDEVLLCKQMGFLRYWKAFSKVPTSSQSPVLFLGYGCDLSATALALRHRHVPIRRIENWELDLISTDEEQSREKKRWDNPTHVASSRKQLNALWPQLLREEEFWKPVSACGLGKDAFFEAALSQWWHELIPGQWEAYRWADLHFARETYSAVIAWEASAGSYRAPILQAARRHGVQTYIYQHGSTARIAGEGWEGLFAHADHFLCYGTGAAERLNQKTIIPVGSARLDDLRLTKSTAKTRARHLKTRSDGHQPRILYIPTFLNGVGYLFDILAGYEPVNYFEVQQRVLSVFKEFPDITLIYKNIQVINSLANPIPDFIRQNIPNAQVVENIRLTDLMWHVDAIIVDHMITALGEVLLTRKPILVYDPGAISDIPEYSSARTLLRKRAIVSETPEDFVNNVRAFLMKGDFSEIDRPNEDFLAAYGTHLNDGHSAKRAADAVLSRRHQP